jgi:NADH-quinone oxidoreductase subunit G
MVTVTIDGHRLEAEAGTTILTVAERLGIEIPTFCYQKRLPVLAPCRMCLVEIEGQGKLHPSCAMAVADGMVVHTNSPRVVDTRAFMLDMLLANHPLDCPICDKGGECELQNLVMAYGPRVSRFREPKRVFHSKDIRLSPVIIMNENRCIQCQRCVRMCEEVVGAVALGTVEKGMDTAVTGFEGSLASCDQCGNCIEVCPVGALMSFPYRYKARPWDLTETDTICPHCGTGCQLTVGARDGELMRVRSKWDHGVNLETLCARGRFGLDFVASKDRIKRPMIRQGGGLVPVSWDEAGAHLRARLSEILADEARTVGGLASPRLTNEALYQFQKLMRTVFRTNNIDSSSRWSVPSDALGPLVANFYGRAPLDDVLLADCVVVVGSNVNEENPVTEYLLRGAARNRHTALYVLSTRPSRLDADARAAIRIPPGEEAAILAAVMARLLNAPADQARLRAAFRNFDAVQASLLSAEPTADGEAFSRLIAALSGGASVTLLAGADLLRSPDPRVSLQMLHGLAQILRGLGKATLVQFLFDRPNQLGAWDLGVLPTALPGLRPVEDATARTLLEQAWGAAIPSGPGVGLDRMLELGAAGTLGVLYLAGADPLLAYPDRALVRRALAGTDLLIVQDAYLTDTAGVADVILPAASYGEESGTFVNNEGRAQHVNKFREPVFEARPNLEIFSFVAALRGRTLDPSGAGEVFDEIARLVPPYGGLTHSWLGDDGAFTSSRPQPSDADLVAPPSPAAVRPDGLVLITGNCLFHSGYLSERSEILRSIADDPFVEMNPHDAEALGLRAQDLVEVRSSRGALQAQLKLSRHFPRGVVFVPENYRILGLNSLLKAGEYPCPVQVRKAREAVETASAAAQSATPA